VRFEYLIQIQVERTPREIRVPEIRSRINWIFTLFFLLPITSKKHS
jgi:hypothetical protein